MKKIAVTLLLAACAHEHVNQSRVFVKTLNPDAEIVGENSVWVLEGTRLAICMPKSGTHTTVCFPLGDLVPDAPKKEEPKKVELPKPEAPKPEAPKVETKKDEPKKP